MTSLHLPSRHLGHGVGLRSEHFPEILASKPQVAWFEAISENFMDTHGRPAAVLEKIRADYPIGLHGTSLSIGSAGGLNLQYLEKLKALADRIQPAIVSDHFCWSEYAGKRLFDLLPLPFTEEAVKKVSEHVDQLQNYLGRTVLLENVSSYISFRHSEMPEWEFLNRVAKQSGCGILLDINNIYVNAFNHGFSPEDYLKGVAPQFVGQYHIAGHTHRGKFLFDTHTGDVIEPVWRLYAEAVKRFGDISCLIEWDTEIRSLKELLEINEKSKLIAEQAPAGAEAAAVQFSAVPQVNSSGSPSLHEVQGWFAEEMIKKTTTPLGPILNTQAGDPGRDRMEVYVEGYPARILEALREAYPALEKVLGEAVFADLARNYAAEKKFEHYNLNRTADALPDFLKLLPWNENLPFLYDLALLERAVQRSFHAAIQPSADPADFAQKAAHNGEMLVFQFQPHVFVVRSHWPVLDIWNARHLDPSKIKIPLEGRAQPVIVFRTGEKVACRQAEVLEAAVLESLMNGDTLGLALDILSESQDAGDVQKWFSSWLTNGLIRGFTYA